VEGERDKPLLLTVFINKNGAESAVFIGLQ
jgi:hypothetical protein